MIYLTIDLESWVHRDMNLIKDFTFSQEKRKYLDNGYIQESTRKIISKILGLERKNKEISTIFFIPGEIYDWNPELIEDISKNFIIGFHTHSHKKLLTEDVLIDELEKSKDFISEYDLKWFRAPEIYIKMSYFKILKDYGFENDSSTYGITKSYVIDSITEVPISSYLYGKTNGMMPKSLTLELLKNEIPFGCGLFLKLIPKRILQSFISHYMEQDIDLMLFIHQWQIYPFKRSNFIRGLPKSLLAAGYYTRLDFAKIESLIGNTNYWEE